MLFWSTNWFCVVKQQSHLVFELRLSLLPSVFIWVSGAYYLCRGLMVGSTLPSIAPSFLISSSLVLFCVARGVVSIARHNVEHLMSELFCRWSILIFGFAQTKYTGEDEPPHYFLPDVNKSFCHINFEIIAVRSENMKTNASLAGERWDCLLCTASSVAQFIRTAIPAH